MDFSKSDAAHEALVGNYERQLDELRCRAPLSGGSFYIDQRLPLDVFVCGNRVVSANNPAEAEFICEMFNRARSMYDALRTGLCLASAAAPAGEAIGNLAGAYIDRVKTALQGLPNVPKSGM